MSQDLDASRRHLIKMANQICANIPVRDDVAGQVAVHLRSFWTPAMRAEIEELARERPDDLVPEVHEALAELRRVA